MQRLFHAAYERFRSPLVTHLAGVALLFVLVVSVSIWICLEWSTLASVSGSSTDAKKRELDSLISATSDLRSFVYGLPDAQRQIDDFYNQRFLANYSSVAQRIGELEAQSGVNFAHVAYSPKPRATGLTEIQLESDVNGEYSQIMRFVNALERDNTFFVIRSMTLTSQQGGLVSLRIRFSTWLRPASPSPGGSTTADAAQSAAHPESDSKGEE